MKLESFAPQVSRNTVSGRVSSPVLEEAYGGNTKGTQAMAGALGRAAEILQIEWQKDQNNRVIDATNDYERQIHSLLYDEKNGLTYTMQGKNAEGMQQAYTEAERKIRADVTKRYGLDSQYAYSAFTRQAENSVTSSLSQIDKYQRQGMTDYAETQLADGLSNFTNGLIRNPGNFAESWANTQMNARAILTPLGLSKEQQDEKIKQQLATAGTDALKNFADNGDFESGLALVGNLRDAGVDEKYLKPYENSFNGKKTVKKTQVSTDKFFADNPAALDKSGDDAWNDFEAAGGYVPPTGNTPLDRVARKITELTGMPEGVAYGWAAHESGDGESTLTTNDNNFFGMKWSGEGDYAEYNTEELDENGNRYTIKDKFQKYKTPEDSAAAAAGWLKRYATPEEIQSIKTGKDLARVLKKHGYFTDNEESYGADVEARAGNYGGSVSEEERAADKERAKNAFLAKRAELIKARDERRSQAVEEINRNLFDMERAGKSSADKMLYLNDALTRNKDLENSGAFRSLWTGANNHARAEENAAIKAELKAKGMTEEGVLAGENFKALLAQIGSEGFRTKEDLKNKFDLMEKAGIGLSPRQVDEFNKAWLDYSQGKGKYGFELPNDKATIARLCGVDEKEVSNETMSIIRQDIYDFMNDKEKNKDGHFPNPDELRDIYWEVIGKQQYGNSWKTGGFLGLWGTEHSVNMSLQDQYRAGIADWRQADDKIGFYVVSAYDGRTRYVTASQMESIANGELNLEDIGR